MTIPQDFDAYIPVYNAIPEDWENARLYIVEQLKQISNAVNIREIGWFLDEELLSGKQFIPGSNLTGTSTQYRSIFRKVIDTGQLPNAGTKTVAHAINFDDNFTLMQIYGAATEPPPGKTAIPLPYVDIDSTKNIQLYMDGTNVIISTAADQSKYTRSFVVIEFIAEL